MAYTTIFEWVADATSTNWRGYTTRMSVAALELEAGTKFRLVAKGHPTQSTTISACVIAEGATTAGTEHGYLYTPIPVTWNGGSPGFTLAANAELASDPITLSYDPSSGRPLVIGTWVEGSVPNNQDDMAANNAVFGSVLRYKTGNDLNNQAPTGYNVATADGWLYTKIEKEVVTAEKKRPVVNFSYFSLASP